MVWLIVFLSFGKGRWSGSMARPVAVTPVLPQHAFLRSTSVVQECASYPKEKAGMAFAGSVQRGRGALVTGVGRRRSISLMSLMLSLLGFSSWGGWIKGLGRTLF
jgi:hypothetical protein